MMDIPLDDNWWWLLMTGDGWCNCMLLMGDDDVISLYIYILYILYIYIIYILYINLLDSEYIQYFTL